MPVLWALVSGNADTDAEEAARMLEARRHKTFKIKMGFGGAETETRRVVRTARAIHQLAPEAIVTVDLNQAWDMTTRSEEHTSELQSLMRNSYAVFCLKKKKHTKQ